MNKWRHTRPMEKERKMTAPGALLSRSPRSFIGASCVYSSSPGSEKSKRMGRNKTTERSAVTSSTQLTLLCVCVIFSLGQPNKRDVREQQNCNKKVRARLCRHCFQTPSIIIIFFFLFFLSFTMTTKMRDPYRQFSFSPHDLLHFNPA